MQLIGRFTKITVLTFALNHIVVSTLKNGQRKSVKIVPKSYAYIYANI